MGNREKYVPLVTFKIDEDKCHICDVFDEIEDAFNDGVKYRHHEAHISRNGGAIVFTLISDIACLQMFGRLVALKGDKIESFSVFPFNSLLDGKDTQRLDEGLIEELIKKLIEKFGKDSIGKSIKKSIEDSGDKSIKRLYEDFEKEIKKLKIET